MIVEPKIRGFICTTAHPTGCEQNVMNFAKYAEKHTNNDIPKRVLVIGSSTGYGLASRICAAFGGGADTVGVYYDRPGSEKRSASAGYYNNVAFEKLAAEKGLKYKSINGDAFSKEIKEQSITAIKETMAGGQVDLVVYSLASPRRTDHEGITYSSVIKPIGEPYTNKTVDTVTGEVTEITVEPATISEIEETVKVMGGEDWFLWMQMMKEAGVLADNLITVAFSYIGPEVTHPIYKNGTIGTAKLDLEQKATKIDKLLSDINGKAFVSINKALVTQASSAIPVVPLYISLIYKIMKENGTHEGCTEQVVRLFDLMYAGGKTANEIPVDDEGRLRVDDLEMDPAVQSQVALLWPLANTQTLSEISDIEGYRKEFLSLFGFGLDDIDYSKDVEIDF